MRMLGQRGDTIVEVLIAVAVVGVLLTGSFASANLNSQAIRTAQERGEAQKLAAGQLEQLRLFLDAPHNTYLDAAVPNTFCLMLQSGAPVAKEVAASTTAPAQNTAIASYPAECRTTGGIVYAMALQRNTITPATAPVPGYSFTVYVRWDGLRGRQEVKFDYAP